MSEFKPGLEGVVAFETEIAEPDRDGGALRYRGVDIEELVGRRPVREGLGAPRRRDARAGPAAGRALRGVAASRVTRPPMLQAVTAHLSGEWGLRKLIDISDEEARDDLARLSATMLSVVAQSARLADGHTTPVDPELVATGATAATRFLLEWRGEADPKHVQAIDTYWICTAEHGLNASTFTARVVASTGADCGAALSSAVGALSGPLHGGAPARVLPMLDGAAAADSIEDYVDRSPRLRRPADGLRSSRLPRRGSALAPPARHGDGSRLAAVRGRRGARAGGAGRAASPQAGPRARDERRVLVGGRARRRRRPAGARAGDVRVLAHGRLVGPHPRAEAARAARAPVGPLRRPRPAAAPGA